MKNILHLICLLFITISFLWIQGYAFTNKDFEIRDLEHKNQDFAIEASYWLPTYNLTKNLYTLCGQTPLLGGYEISSNVLRLRRSYSPLPVHQSVFISISLWLIDKWNLYDYFILTISNGTKVTFSENLVKIISASTWSQKLCGDQSTPDLQPVTIVIQAPHTGNKLAIEFYYANFDSFMKNDGGFAGLRDLNILLSTQTLEASSFCGITRPMNLLYENNCSCAYGQYMDPTIVQCKPCNSACGLCFGPTSSECYSCSENYIYTGTSCMACDNTCNTCFGTASNECLTCRGGYHLSENNTCLNSYSAAVEAKGTTDSIVGIGLLLMNLANQGSPSSVSLAVLAKMLQYIKYLDISYSPGLKDALDNWDSDFLALNINIPPPGELKSKNIYKASPEVFARYDVEPSFLFNFWQELIFLTFTTSSFILLIGVEILIKDSFQRKYIFEFVQKVRKMLQGFSLMILYNSFGDITIFSILEYRSSKGNFDLSKLSLLVSIAFIIFNIVIFTNHIQILLKRRNIMQRTRNINNTNLMQEFDAKNESFKSFFNDYKSDSLSVQGCLLFFIIRDVLFSIILACLFEHPLAQMIIIITLNILIILYLGIKRPYLESSNGYQQIFGELILLIVNTCIFVMAIFDLEGEKATNRRDSLGQVIILLNLIFNFVILFILLAKLFIFAKNTYKKWSKSRQIKKVHTEVQLHTISSQTNNQNLESLQENTFGTKQEKIYMDQTECSRNKSFANQSKNNFESKMSFLENSESSFIHKKDDASLHSQILSHSKQRKDLLYPNLTKEDFNNSRNFNTSGTIKEFENYDFSSLSIAQRALNRKNYQSKIEIQDKESKEITSNQNLKLFHLVGTGKLKDVALKRNSELSPEQNPSKLFFENKQNKIIEEKKKNELDYLSPFFRRFYQNSEKNTQTEDVNSNPITFITPQENNLTSFPLKNKREIQGFNDYKFQSKTSDFLENILMFGRTQRNEPKNINLQGDEDLETVRLTPKTKNFEEEIEH